jgi:predicted PurR-regulated permease PerM
VWRLVDIILLGFAGVLFAVFLRACAEPVRRATRLPESWALVVVGLVLLGLTALSGWLLLPSLVVQAGEFLARLPDLVSQLEAALIEIPFLGDALQGTPALSGMADRASDLLARAFSTLSSTFGALANVLLVVITGVFLAAEPKLYRHDLLRLVPPSSRDRARDVLDKLGRTLGAWLFGQLLDMTFVAVLTFLGVWIIGLPYALALGVTAGLLDFIPIIGPVLGAAPALLWP